MFWIAFIGAYLFLLAISGAIVENYPRIKRRAAGVLYYSIRRIQKMFKTIFAQQGEVVNRKVIYK